jgi:RES domain-containing protein
MRVFRLCKQIYSDTVLSGQGGLIADGRWHSAGRPIVYTASSEALAVLEIRVHLGRFVPKAPYAVHVIEVPDSQVQMLVERELGKNWNAVPAMSHTRRIGDDWLNANSSSALSVPSIHSTTDRNILINPAHPAASSMALIQVNSYQFDPRLFSAVVRSRRRRLEQ